ncbi:hypothetical protein O6H91_14G049500 [Diphasiastrum complanatum]|uniref:Uncharacterized protein n=1 Tax=Diphasiastrum complanatum TaxID=34168 RepID=A0ACC2BPZ4_DIPCM|nr:hypothetical protein O6H91_14G049500 [Diphasiastrum complanatum]
MWRVWRVVADCFALLVDLEIRLQSEEHGRPRTQRCSRMEKIWTEI